MGLSMYDWLARDDALPSSASVPLNDPTAPRVDPSRYRSMIAYSDAQMRYPERVVVALLADAAEIACESKLSLTVATYGELQFADDNWRLTSPLLDQPLGFRPALIVNACGASGDASLHAIGAVAAPLFGGTKGSHVLTWHAGLRQALNGQAVYAEAHDGRPVFTLPFGDGVLIGTTDEAFQGDPEDAIATDEEIQYLLEMVYQVFAIPLTRDDVTAHYSGVRPLPHADSASNAAISRDHSLVWHTAHDVPVLTLVGGKLTTWRSFAEEVTNHVLGKLGYTRLHDTLRRRIPGNDPLPDNPSLNSQFENWAREAGTTTAEVSALWPLLGTRVRDLLLAVGHEPRHAIADTPISDRSVRWIIRQEHVATLDDLVERRLLTVFQATLSLQHLHDLAACLVETGSLAKENAAEAVAAAAARLSRHFGRRLR
ncbi:MAG: hypothetical protein B7Z55_08270 [Planctomycetales bacterium 12-60-4]|nr:MAG: hypothetical protein B7Z55_08270 [Planctomycetales bacterium 12-60-4]